jgi:hypothetical protein
MKGVLFLSILAVFPAAAQWRHFGSEPAHATGYFGMGFASPVNPVARQLDTGWTIGGGGGITSKYAGLMVDAMFTDFGLNHNVLRTLDAPQGSQKYWALTVDPVFHVNDRGPIDFYVTGGGGLYGQITSLYYGGNYGGVFGGSDLTNTYSIYKAGVDGGAGFAFNIGDHGSHIKVYTEARFHHMFTHRPGASFIPVTVGIRF